MTLSTIYLICAVAGGTILAIKLVLMIIGMDHPGVDIDSSAGVDVPTDAQVDLSHDGMLSIDSAHATGVNFLSLQSIAGFFTMFGLVGLGLLQTNAADLWSLVGALAAGLFTAWATGMIFFNMRRLQSEGTLVINNAIGQEGTVYLTIPEKGSGVVSVTVQGALRNLDAVSDHGQRIPTGAMVKVLRISAGKILVVSEKYTETQS